MVGFRVRGGRVLMGALMAVVFVTFCAGRCSSEQRSADETATSFVAGKKAGPGEKKQEGKPAKAAQGEPGEKEAGPGQEAAAEPAGPPPDAMVIAGAGDIILHGRVKGTADHQAASPSEEGDDNHAGWWHLFKHLVPVLAKAHVSLANLETPIATERKKASGRPPVLNGPAESLGAMKEAGFSMMSAANNHAFDQMREGVGETVDAIGAAGMDPIGAGHSRDEAETPVFKEAGGIRAAFLSWTVTPNKNFNDVKTKHKPWVNVYKEEVAVEIVKKAREEADLVVVSMHWGGEFDLKAGSKQKSIAKKLCKEGADIIFGHGPHVLHDVDILEPDGEGGRKCVVAYSLGNLLSNQGLKYRYGWNPPNLVEAKNIPYTRDGIILRVTVRKGEGGVVVDRIEAVPLWNQNNWIERYVQKTVPPDDITIIPIMPAIEAIAEEDSKDKLLLKERLGAIKEMVGDKVTYVDL
jgi:hypothetical protein